MCWEYGCFWVFKPLYMQKNPEMMEQSWLWMEQNKNRPNDTRKPAAYIVKAALDPEKLVAGSSVWCFSDIFEEFSEIPEEFHGGFGLLTHSGIPKPAYYAMKMLAELCDNRIVLDKDASDGEMGIAAFEDVDKMQILLFRQKMKNEVLPKEHIEVEVALERNPKEVFLERIDEEHCNPLQLWEEMGSPQELTNKQKEMLLGETALKMEGVSYEYTEHRLTLKAEMGVNDVWIYALFLIILYFFDRQKGDIQSVV